MTFSASEIDRAREQLVNVIAAEVALKRQGTAFSGLCCFHKEKSPSFTVVPEKGFFHCFGCGAHGSAIDFVMRHRGLNFVEAVTELLNLPPQRPRAVIAAPRHQSGPAPDPSETVRQILAGAGPVTQGTGAHLYLWSRGLVDRWHPHTATSLLAHPSLYCAEIRKTLPALVAEITSVTGIITALQRIWVSPRLEYADGVGPKDARADLEIRKKTIGAMGNGAVRLKPASEVLGLAEGVETALAAMRLFNIPVWATCGAVRLGSIAIPRTVDLVIILGDNGEIGHTAAEAARREYLHQGFGCDVLFPPYEHGDFNDELLHRTRAA